MKSYKVSEFISLSPILLQSTKPNNSKRMSYLVFLSNIIEYYLIFIEVNIFVKVEKFLDQSQ